MKKTIVKEAIKKVAPNYYYASTLNGQKINLKNDSNVTAVSGRYLGKKQSKYIKQFAKYRYEKGSFRH